MFKSNSLKGKQKELKEMSYIDHLEELEKVYVGDIEDIEELQEVLGSLGYITSFENEYLILENVEEKRQTRINEVKRSLLKNKGGGGGYTYRVSIPVDFIRELGMEDDEEVILSLQNEKIVIRKGG